MAYKIGSTVVIDASGNIPMAKVTGVPTFVPANTNFSLGSASYVTVGAGPSYTGYTLTGIEFTGSTYRDVYTRTTI